MNDEPSAELIRFARRHRYHIAEGFCDSTIGGELENAIEDAIDDLASEEREFLESRAADLSIAAGIPIPAAQSALLNWILKRHCDEWNAQ
jgi:hypothetical protein